MGEILKRSFNTCSALAAVLLCGTSTAALAQTSSAADTLNQSAGLEDIVVTARRVSESLQDTPVAVTSFSSQAIDRTFALDIRALAGQIPNMVITNVPGFNAASIGIRGQSTGDILLTFEPAIGVVVDDFVLAHVQTQLFDLFDVERIEVLRGPQGTLFGKNTIGGVVNVITKMPEEEFSGEVRLGYSSFNTFMARGALNVPLTSNLFFRGSVSYNKSDGIYRNTKFNFVDNIPGDGRSLGGAQNVSGRAKLLWKPGPDTDILLTYEICATREIRRLA